MMVSPSVKVRKWPEQFGDEFDVSRPWPSAMSMYTDNQAAWLHNGAKRFLDFLAYYEEKRYSQGRDLRDLKPSDRHS